MDDRLDHANAIHAKVGYWWPSNLLLAGWFLLPSRVYYWRALDIRTEANVPY